MESVNETPMKRKRGRPRKSEASKQSNDNPLPTYQNIIEEVLEKNYKMICNYVDENVTDMIKKMVNDVSNDLSDILTNMLNKIDQIKYLTKEITRDEHIKEIIKEELQKIHQEETSEMDILRRELFDLKEKFHSVYQHINRCEETITSTEL